MSGEEVSFGMDFVMDEDGINEEPPLESCNTEVGPSLMREIPSTTEMISKVANASHSNTNRDGISSGIVTAVDNPPSGAKAATTPLSTASNGQEVPVTPLDRRSSDSKNSNDPRPEKTQSVASQRSEVSEGGFGASTSSNNSQFLEEMRRKKAQKREEFNTKYGQQSTTSRD